MTPYDIPTLLQKMLAKKRAAINTGSHGQKVKLGLGATDNTDGHTPKSQTHNFGVGSPIRKAALPAEPNLERVARQYMLSAGMRPNDHFLDYVKVDEPRARQVASDYESAPHSPNDPETRSSYEALKKETVAQFNHLLKSGYKLEPWTQPGQPYKNSEQMASDVHNNRHLYFFTGGDMPADHPLAEPTGHTIKGVQLNHNDAFRAVHDVFGHAHHGNQFGPRGEEHAWRAHSQMFSEQAKPAMTAETKGQNSWVNFGPHSDKPVTERPYAQQKATTMKLARRALGMLVRKGGDTTGVPKPPKRSRGPLIARILGPDPGNPSPDRRTDFPFGHNLPENQASTDTPAQTATPVGRPDGLPDLVTEASPPLTSRPARRPEIGEFTHEKYESLRGAPSTRANTTPRQIYWKDWGLALQKANIEDPGKANPKAVARHSGAEAYPATPSKSEYAGLPDVTQYGSSLRGLVSDKDHDFLRESLSRHPSAPLAGTSIPLLQTAEATAIPAKKKVLVEGTAREVQRALAHGGSIEDYIAQNNVKPAEADELRLAAVLRAGLHEATHQQATQEDAGHDWYKEQVSDYVDGSRHVASKAYGLPESYFGKVGDKNLTPEMKLFMFLTAGTSNGATPTDNGNNAHQMFELGLRANPSNPFAAIPTKKPNGKAWSVRQEAVEQLLAYLHNLTLPRGKESQPEANKRAADFLDKSHPADYVRDMKKFLHGKDVATDLPFGDDHLYPGSYILGPKLGPFYKNLTGDDRHLTADIWWTRTWGRLTGKLFHTKATGEEELVNTPSGDKQRKLMFRAAKIAAKHLNMSVADFQAVMWYYEKRLYEAMGQAPTRSSYAEARQKVFGRLDPSGGLEKSYQASRQAGSRRKDAPVQKSRSGSQGPWQEAVRRLLVDPNFSHNYNVKLARRTLDRIRKAAPTAPVKGPGSGARTVYGAEGKGSGDPRDSSEYNDLPYTSKAPVAYGKGPGVNVNQNNLRPPQYRSEAPVGSKGGPPPAPLKKSLEEAPVPKYGERKDAWIDRSNEAEVRRWRTEQAKKRQEEKVKTDGEPDTKVQKADLNAMANPGRSIGSPDSPEGPDHVHVTYRSGPQQGRTLRSVPIRSAAAMTGRSEYSLRRALKTGGEHRSDDYHIVAAEKPGQPQGPKVKKAAPEEKKTPSPQDNRGWGTWGVMQEPPKAKPKGVGQMKPYPDAPPAQEKPLDRTVRPRKDNQTFADLNKPADPLIGTGAHQKRDNPDKGPLADTPDHMPSGTKGKDGIAGNITDPGRRKPQPMTVRSVTDRSQGPPPLRETVANPTYMRPGRDTGADKPTPPAKPPAPFKPPEGDLGLDPVRKAAGDPQERLDEQREKNKIAVDAMRQPDRRPKPKRTISDEEVEARTGYRKEYTARAMNVKGPVETGPAGSGDQQNRMTGKPSMSSNRVGVIPPSQPIEAAKPKPLPTGQGAKAAKPARALPPPTYRPKRPRMGTPSPRRVGGRIYR